MSRSLAIALAALAAATAWPLLRAAIDRAGAPQARLAIEECRLDIDLARGGLVAALAGRGPLDPAPASHYAPEDESRPLAERVAALGLDRGPRFVHLALEASGPAVVANAAAGDRRRPPAVRDFSRDAGLLRERYAAFPAVAVMPGIAALADEGSQEPVLRPRPRQLALSAGQTEVLRGLAPRARGRECRSRILAIVEFGNLGYPRVADFRTIETEVP